MPTGTIKFFNDSKGFGFIQSDELGEDVFVHMTAVERAGWKTLSEGQEVSFEVQNDPQKNKKNAVNLKNIA